MLSENLDLASQYSRTTSIAGNNMASSTAPATPEVALLRYLISRTLTFPKMLDYYHHNLSVDIVKEKLQISIAQKMGKKINVCPLCQRILK